MADVKGAEVTGRHLAQRCRTVDALLAATPDEIAETPGIGPIVAGLIHRQLADQQMRDLLAYLRGLGLRLELEGPPPGEGPLRELIQMTSEKSARLSGPVRPQPLSRTQPMGA